MDDDAAIAATDLFIPATGHTEVIDAAIAATCTATGLTAGKHCSVCGEIFVVQTETPQIDHADENGDALCDMCNTQPEITVLLGDVDGNGEISSADARPALRASVGPDTLTTEQTLAADVNKDSEVTSADARLILRAAVGLEEFNTLSV